jgi:outer membrane lipoprotein-sorting protein
MSHFLRRLPLPRLLLLCTVALAVGVGASALASALGAGPKPPPKPLAQAVHDALLASAPAGVSARIQYTDHLLEGASLAAGDGAGGALASSPLLAGATGRLWIAKDGRVRVELQSEKGDTEILYDGHELTLYDPTTNTLYRYAPPQGEGTSSSSSGSTSYAPLPGSDGAGGVRLEYRSAAPREVPSVAKIEEAISRLSPHATLSPATPADVAGQAAYTVRVSPSHNGGLLGGAELSFDAVHGVPLRAAVYSSKSPAPVLELAATEISYEPVPASVFEISPPPGAKVQEVSPPKEGSAPSGSSTGADSTGAGWSSPSSGAGHPKVTTHGQGLETVAVLESPVKAGAGNSSPTLPEGLQKVDINGVTASELPTALGTLLTFERSGVRYLLAGAVSPAKVEEVARGL